MTEKIPGCVWTNEAVTLLLTLYLREKQKDHPVKLKKKEIWKYICGELWARGLLCSWQECDKKYRNLKQTFVRNLKQAGKKECRWMFFPIMLEINKHEPFVNEMVTNAFAHSSSNTSISDYDNDDCSQDGVPVLQQPLLPLLQSANVDDDCVQQHQLYTNNTMIKPTEIPDILLQNRMMMHNPFFNRVPMIRPSKTPSPHRMSPCQPQTSPLSLTSNLSPHRNGVDSTINSIIHMEDKSAYCSLVDTMDGPHKKLRRTDQHHSIGNDADHINNRDTVPPPIWFKEFLVEFKRAEERKMQTIQDLCDEVRRTNDIEHQRNVILNEKNELLKNLMDLMGSK